MPVYEYRCHSCHQIFEYQQRMADAPKTVCESCSGALERIISRSAFQFKGGGWYKDLYSSSKPESGGSTGSSSAGSSGSGDAGSSGGSTSGGSSDSGSSSGTGAGSASPAAAGPAK